MASLVEENYLKVIYHLSNGGKEAVSTNALAENMKNKAASVTDMIKRMSAKGMISYEKYRGVNISDKGKAMALTIIRKHRLWETFLVEKLGFHWDEVHEVAEQLEHIQSHNLIEKLDDFLGHPVADPHGHPIPDKHGKLKEPRQTILADWPAGKDAVVKSVRDSSPALLQFMSKIGVYIGANICIDERREFDGSLEIRIDGKKKSIISKEVSQNLLVTAPA